MPISDNLFKISASLEEKSKILTNEEFCDPLNSYFDAAEQIGKSWSGSWFGYQAYVYYYNFEPPPDEAHFSKEWGLSHNLHDFMKETTGNWKEYKQEQVLQEIRETANNKDLANCIEKSTEASDLFSDSKSEILSLISIILKGRDDNFLQKLYKEIDNIKLLKYSDFIKSKCPRRSFMLRDHRAIEGGLVTPPHYQFMATIFEIENPFLACEKLSKITRRAASHIMNIEKLEIKSERIGVNVFIGHGQSPLWRELKDFIKERVHLPCDEFNRIPIAGMTNITRLSQMLDEAAIAFLLMTAEDEQSDGKKHARQNVIHEAGLFQGRLGFERAIILLEEGCEEFSNIQGLGQIRFPKGNISASFEEIRQILERENLVGKNDNKADT